LIQLLSGMPLLNALVNIALLYLAWSIYGEVRNTNGRLIRLETWQPLHEAQDEERHQGVNDTLNLLRSSLLNKQRIDTDGHNHNHN
ncbi:MAG: hypothetical protein VW577_06925, partial [Pelagibacteraceae bacterium]